MDNSYLIIFLTYPNTCSLQTQHTFPEGALVLKQLVSSLLQSRGPWLPAGFYEARSYGMHSILYLNVLSIIGGFYAC